MRIRTLATIAITAALTIGTVTTAQAVPSGDNVLRGFCAATIKTSCVSVMDNDEGHLQVRDRRGHRVNLTSSAAALRYLRHHSKPCRLEDSPSCYWNAGHRGNGVGDSFIAVGSKGLFYLGNLD